MKQFIVCSTSGQIFYTISPSCESDFEGGLHLPPDQLLYEVSMASSVNPALHGFDRGTKSIYELGAPTTEHHVFDYILKQWVDPRTLQDFKTAKWAEVKQHRDDTENGGFTWGGSTFDSTPISQSRIQGAAQLATLAKINNQPFSIEWTLADNSARTLNAQEMIAVGTAMGQHINACHTRARQLRSLIEAAQTKEEVEAIYWGMIENGLENPDVPVFTRNE